MLASVRSPNGDVLADYAPQMKPVLDPRALFDKEIAFVKRCGREPPRDIKLGAMVEVPSLLWEIEEIAEAADFLSVGSNDLMQYVFAADRVNKRVAGRFDELSPSFLRALKSIADAGARHRTPVKGMVVSLDAGAAALELQALLTDPDRHGSLRAPLQALAERLAVRL